nr:glycosyltransferase family 2 protein [uncultured Leptotrichia sp.]
MKKLTIIAPMYNEESLVSKYCEQVFKDLKSLEKNYDIEILMINDGSKDSTWKQMNEMYKKYYPKISLINLSRNFGLEGAINAGLEKAKGNIVIAMDADLQDPPSVILELVKKYEEGYDVVIAKRKKRKSDTFFKRFSANLYYKISDKLSGKLKLERNAANFRLLSRKVVNELNKLEEKNKVFRVTVPFVGMKTAIVEYDRDQRFSGKTKYNLFSMTRYALDGITSISIEPLRKIFTISIFSSIATILLLILSIINYNQKLYILGFIIGVFSTMILVSLTIIGEYVGQIMVESKRRPISIIDDYKTPNNIEK